MNGQGPTSELLGLPLISYQFNRSKQQTMILNRQGPTSESTWAPLNIRLIGLTLQTIRLNGQGPTSEATWAPLRTLSD